VSGYARGSRELFSILVEPRVMDARRVGYAVAAGVGVFLTVFAAVTTLFGSVLVFAFALAGIPAGLIGGIAAAVFVLQHLDGGPHQELALGLGTFGIINIITAAIVIGLGSEIIASLGLGHGIIVSVGLSSLVGVLGAAVRVLS
jgi:hypothetical protein